VKMNTLTLDVDGSVRMANGLCVWNFANAVEAAKQVPTECSAAEILAAPLVQAALNAPATAAGLAAQRKGK
jgi:hypothetical protein